MKCEICEKGPSFGHNVSHSNRKTNRAFQPNVQQRVLTIEGNRQRIAVCTRCLRTLQKIATA